MDYVKNIKLLVEEGRRLNTKRAVKLRTTLKVKGKKKSLVARSDNKGRVKVRLKTGHDVLKRKVKALRNKHNPLAKRKKQRRAFRLTDRGIRS